MALRNALTALAILVVLVAGAGCGATFPIVQTPTHAVAPVPSVAPERVRAWAVDMVVRDKPVGRRAQPPDASAGELAVEYYQALAREPSSALASQATKDNAAAAAYDKQLGGYRQALANADSKLDAYLRRRGLDRAAFKDEIEARTLALARNQQARALGIRFAMCLKDYADALAGTGQARSCDGAMLEVNDLLQQNVSPKAVRIREYLPSVTTNLEARDYGQLRRIAGALLQSMNDD